MGSPIGDRLLRIVLAHWGDIEEWKLADPAVAAARGFPRRVSVEGVDEGGILFVDVTIDARTGSPVCHEVNGSNAVGSDALTGDSRGRAGIEVRHALRRIHALGLRGAEGRLARPLVTIHAHQHWGAFRTGGEFYPRVGLFAEGLADLLPGVGMEVRGALEDLGDEDLSVVVGDVPSIGEHLEPALRGEGFLYRGRPVVFLGNPNLAVELLRRGRLRREDARIAGADLGSFLCPRLLHLVHDKATQQALFEGTAIRPLACFEAWSRGEAIARTIEHLARGPFVLKPNGGSGGTGVRVAVPSMDDAELRAVVDGVTADFAKKYGESSERVLFPIRGFEFVRSTGLPMEDGEHLWDLRVAVEFEAGMASLYPVSFRLTPAAFDERTFHLDRDQWISNVSGRKVTLLRSGLDAETLHAVGMTDARLDEVLAACAAWTVNAWRATAPAAAPVSLSYEDECEKADAAFYPREKFLRP